MITKYVPVAVDGVFGGFGFQVGGDVFDDAGSGATGAGELAAAVGAGWQFVGLLVVDAFRLGSCVTFMSGFGAWLFAAFGCWRGLVERRNAAGWSVRRDFLSDGGGELKEEESGFERVSVEEDLGLGFGELTGAKGVKELGIELQVGGDLGDSGCHASVIQ